MDKVEFTRRFHEAIDSGLIRAFSSLLSDP